MRRIGSLFLLMILLSSSARAEVYGPAAGGKPTSLVFMLHGQCSDGQSMAAMAYFFGRRMPNTVFVAPDAPYEGCANGKYQWPMEPKEIEKLIPMLDQMLASQKESFEIPSDKTAVMGFSLGGGLAIIEGINNPGGSRAVLAISPAFEEGLLRMPHRPDSPVIHVIGGKKDQVVSYDSVAAQVKKLQESGYEVTSRFYDEAGHMIAPEQLQTGISFLREALYGM